MWQYEERAGLAKRVDNAEDAGVRALGPEDVLLFGRFALYRRRKLLLLDGVPVHLGSRAFELLIALACRAGQVVSQKELVAAVWPTTVVEENSLRVHISALRRTLGGLPEEPFIVTVPGRGYSFVMPITVESMPIRHTSPVVGWSPMPAASGLVSRLSQMIGRELALDDLKREFDRARVVTLVGTGGIGKTTLAVAYASENSANYPQGVVVIDLSAVADPDLLPSTVATALGMSLGSEPDRKTLRAALSDTHVLIVLDNCEHLVDATAALVEDLLDASDHLQVLATSREPLYCRGERIQRLAPLTTPMDETALTIDQALEFSAIALFVERAKATTDRFFLSEGNVANVAYLCRQLDGLPLALELAAARVDSLGVQGLAERIDDIFGLLTRGRRMALPRHAALQAVFDCSHLLLGELEKVVLRRLSVFRSGFSLETAAVVCSCTSISHAQVLESVLTLATKSLLAVDVGAGYARYRLLNTTRRYAASHLSRSADLQAVALRYTGHLIKMCDRARTELGDFPLMQWNARYGGSTPDLFCAMEWAFGDHGNTRIGIELCAAIPFPMIELGMVGEYRRRVEMALERIPSLRSEEPGLIARLSELEWRLLSGWTMAAGHADVRPIDRQRKLERLELMPTGAVPVDCETIALSSMVIAAFTSADYPRVGNLALRLRRHAELYSGTSDSIAPVVNILADRWNALEAHYMGRHQQAREFASKVLAQSIPGGAVPVLGQTPQTVSMGIVIGRSEWLMGYPERAMASVQEVVALSEGEHPFALCQALALGLLPVALWRGEHALACSAAERLMRHAARHAIQYWVQWANSLARGLGMTGLPQDAEGEPSHYITDNVMAWDLQATLFPAAVTEATCTRVDSRTVLWCAPEIMRVRAEQVLARNGDPGLVELQLMQAKELAHSQGALAWELRCAMSLARLWESTGRGGSAGTLLAGVYGKFTEGCDTADLQDARALLLRLQMQRAHVRI